MLTETTTRACPSTPCRRATPRHGRLVAQSASGATLGETPFRRHRFTIARELGHWVCHVLGAAAGLEPAPT